MKICTPEDINYIFLGMGSRNLAEIILNLDVLDENLVENMDF
jgi:hypothetical protein